MTAGGQRDSGSGDRLPYLPAAGIGNRNRTGLVDAVDLDVQPAAGAHVRDADVERVGSRLRHIHRVRQPLAGSRLQHVVAAAGVSGCFQIHVGRTIHAAGISRRRVEVSDRLAALVEVFRLEGSRNRRRRAAERGRSARARAAGREAPDRTAADLPRPCPADDTPEICRAWLQTADRVSLDYAWIRSADLYVTDDEWGIGGCPEV